ncbi:MAG: C39 family peptidase [Planctomycetota bacterium]
MNDREEVQRLYDRHLFLQAYRLSAAYWNPGTNVGSLTLEELVLGGRLAARLGGSRLSRWLFREAARREPAHPLVRYFARHVRRRGFDTYDLLWDYERRPELGSSDPELNASWYASQAEVWASLHDFDRAFACLERAHSFCQVDAWVLSCESQVLLLADRWEEALRAAERAWELGAGAPYSANALGQSLTKCGRLEEAARRLAEAADKGESLDIAYMACWQLCAWTESLDARERPPVVEQARALAERLPALAPLADREARSAMARARLDVAFQAGDEAEMRRQAEEVRSNFTRRVLENMRRHPDGRRVCLPYRRVFQKHETCLPSSIAAALAAQGVDLDAEELASEVTYGGTAMWAAAEWLERKGLSVRAFLVTPETAVDLLRDGLPFVLSLESESEAHAVAVVGWDEAAGTLLMHDPSSPRVLEYLLDSLGEGEVPLGPKGLVAVPPERRGSIERILPADKVEAMTALNRHQRALDLGDALAASAIVDGLVERLPRHPMTRYLQALRLQEAGRSGEALSSLQGLMNEFPNCLRVRRALMASCRALGNTALLRGALAGVVERGVLPGVTAGQDWRYPPPTYICQYADLLRQSALTRKRAFGLLRSLIRRHYSHGEAWHILADLLRHDRGPQHTLLAFRAAACAEHHSSHYARAYSDALRAAGREEEGLSWLESRARRLGALPRAGEPWVTWIDALEDYGHPERALSAYGEASRIRGEVPELLAFAVSFLARMGHWDEAQATLRRLEASGHRLLHCDAAVAFFRMRGEWEIALGFAQEWVRLAPQSMQARWHQLELTARRDGHRAAAELSASWLGAQPEHEELEEMHYERLSVIGARKEQDVLLDRRVQRNAEDGWAWRELAFRRLDEFDRAAAARRDELRPHIERLLRECDRTAPEHPATQRAHGLWEEVYGHYTEAIRIWLQCIEAEPTSLYSYRRAWDCAASLPSERESLVERFEPHLFRCTGHLHVARELLMLITRRFGAAAGETVAQRWLARRPDDPEVIEAVADRLLEYGHGRSDAARAHALVEPAVHCFPYHVDLRLSLAHALAVLGRHEESQATLREIIRRHPACTPAILRLARVLERRGDREGASEWLEMAAERAPLDTDVWRARLRFLIRGDRFAEARTLIREGLDRLPESVDWRESAINGLFDCNDEKGAVDVAREGVRIYEDGAYLWYLLADTLSRSRELGDLTEVESCLRRSLSLNASLFEAADLLARVLVGQRRYAEAEQVIGAIRTRMMDPSPAAGRLAWVQRSRELRNEARQQMAEIVRSTPWYLWGWGQLMEWLVEDKAWDEAVSLLQPCPPECHNETRFRRHRLSVLAAAQRPAEELEREWEQLLRDFPEDVGLHLERYDELWKSGRKAEAGGVLEAIRPLDPESPYVLARHVEVVADRGDRAAIGGLMKIWFMEVQESSWPARYAWEAVTRAAMGKEAYAAARDRLQGGARPTPQAMYLMASEAMAREARGRSAARSRLRTWFPGPGARELRQLLAFVDQAPWEAGRLRGIILERMEEIGYERLVTRYGRGHPERVESDPFTWGQVGYALRLRDRKAALAFFGRWREHAGVEMWVVANYVFCLDPEGDRGLREIAASCRDALETLPHDCNAKYLAHMCARACVLLEDEDGFRDAWRRYRAYFTRSVQDGEYMAPTTRFLVDVIPDLGEALDRGEPIDFREAAQRMRKEGRQNPNYWRALRKPLWLALMLALFFLLRLCSELLKPGHP